MKIEEVKKAQEVIRNAKKELAFIVKRKLENGGCFNISDVTYKLRKNKEFKVLKFDFVTFGVVVSVYLYEPEEESLGWSYKFSCEDIELHKIPPTGYKGGTAKGNIIEVKYRNSRQKLINETIILKEFYNSNEHLTY